MKKYIILLVVLLPFCGKAQQFKDALGFGFMGHVKTCEVTSSDFLHIYLHSVEFDNNGKLLKIDGSDVYDVKHDSKGYMLSYKRIKKGLLFLSEDEEELVQFKYSQGRVSMIYNKEKDGGYYVIQFRYSSNSKYPYFVFHGIITEKDLGKDNLSMMDLLADPFSMIYGFSCGGKLVGDQVDSEGNNTRLKMTELFYEMGGSKEYTDVFERKFSYHKLLQKEKSEKDNSITIRDGVKTKLITEKNSFQWYEVSSYQNGVHKYGAKSSDGKWIIPFQRGRGAPRTTVTGASVKFYFGFENGNEALYDASGKVIIPENRGYEFICVHDLYITIRKNGQEGACDLTGKEVIAPMYCDVYAHERKNKIYYEVVTKDGKVGVYDAAGKLVIEPNYKKVYAHECKNMIYYEVVTKDGKVGVHDAAGKLIIEPNYKDVCAHENENMIYYKVVTKDGKVGVHDTKGRLLLSPDKKYSKGLIYDKGAFKYKTKDDKWEDIGQVTNVSTSSSSSVSKKPQSTNPSGVSTSSSKQTKATNSSSPAKSPQQLPSSSTAVIENDVPKEELITENGGFQWYKLSLCEGGVNKYGAKSLNGKWIIRLQPGRGPIVTELGGVVYFSFRLESGCEMLYDASGKVLIPEKRGYDRIRVDEGYIEVEMREKRGVCNLNGKEVIKPEYAYVYYLQSTTTKKNYYMIETADHKIGVYDVKGRLVLSPDKKYSHSLVYLNDKEGFKYLSDDGKWVLTHKKLP